MIGVGKIPRAKGSQTRLGGFSRKLVTQANLMTRIAFRLDDVLPSTAADEQRNAKSTMASNCVDLPRSSLLPDAGCVYIL
jgi:hypothetical protein